MLCNKWIEINKIEKSITAVLQKWAFERLNEKYFKNIQKKIQVRRYHF